MLNPPAALLLDHLDLLKGLDHALPVLDLACGSGRNGLVLAREHIPVVFADNSVSALHNVQQSLLQADLPGQTWNVDLEQDGVNPLAGQAFSGILGFNYLHRPLFPALQNSLMPGGLVIYETFTTEQAHFGKPRNPDFLLQPGELKQFFKTWKIIFEFEGMLKNPDRCAAQIVARKPGTR